MILFVPIILFFLTLALIGPPVSNSRVIKFHCYFRRFITFRGSNSLFCCNARNKSQSAILTRKGRENLLFFTTPPKSNFWPSLALSCLFLLTEEKFSLFAQQSYWKSSSFLSALDIEISLFPRRRAQGCLPLWKTEFLARKNLPLFRRLVPRDSCFLDV